MLPDIINSTPPAPPTKLSCTAKLVMTKKQSREMRRLLNPLTRPAQVPPRKKVAWRLVRKWFNRYEKPRLIGACVVATSKDGKTQIPMRITNVRIDKAGGRKRDYSFTATPI